MLRILVIGVALGLSVIAILVFFGFIAALEDGIVDYEFEKMVAIELTDKVIIDESVQEELIDSPPLISTQKVWVKNRTGGHELKSKYIYQAGFFKTKEKEVLLKPGTRIEKLQQFRFREE